MIVLQEFWRAKNLIEFHSRMKILDLRIFATKSSSFSRVIRRRARHVRYARVTWVVRVLKMEQPIIKRALIKKNLRKIKLLSSIMIHEQWSIMKHEQLSMIMHASKKINKFCLFFIRKFFFKLSLKKFKNCFQFKSREAKCQINLNAIYRRINFFHRNRLRIGDGGSGS